MSRLAFRLQSIPAASGSVVRIDTASGSNTPADLRTLGGNAIDGAIIRSGSNGGHLPTVLGPDGVTTLYQKVLDYRGQVTGTPVTLTGEDDNPSTPNYGGGGGAPVNETVTTVAASGTAQTIATAAGITDITLTANCTLTMPAGVTGASFTLILRQDATGSRVITWPAGLKWPNGFAPALTPTPSTSDIFAFTYVAGSWIAFPAGYDVR